MEFWNLIVQSNTFNFLIFIGLFALLFKKINFGAMMDKLQAKVMSLIEDAKRAKDDSIVELKELKKFHQKFRQKLEIFLIMQKLQRID